MGLAAERRLTAQDWSTYLSKFNQYWDEVPDATEEEAYRYLMQQLPSNFAEKIVREAKKSANTFKVRIGGLSMVTRHQLEAFLEEATQVIPRKIAMMGDFWEVDVSNEDDQQKILALNQQTTTSGILLTAMAIPQNISTRKVISLMNEWLKDQEIANYFRRKSDDWERAKGKKVLEVVVAKVENVSHEVKEKWSQTPPQNDTQKKQTTQKSNGGGCWNCGSQDHWSMECPENPRRGKPMRGKGEDRSQNSSKGRGRVPPHPVARVGEMSMAAPHPPQANRGAKGA